MITDPAIRAARYGKGKRKLADARGLYLLLHPNGSKYWRLKYRVNRHEKTLALGVYPEVGVAEARRRRDAARLAIQDGRDPSAERQKTKHAARDSFEAVAREWIQTKSATWTPGHVEKVLRILEREVFPWIGGEPVGELTAPKLLSVLRRTESRGIVFTAHRVHQIMGRVMRYAVATGRAESDVSVSLRGALRSTQTRHRAAITEPKKIGELLRAIDGYTGEYVTRAALELAPLLFVRPGELRKAEWAEFDLDKAEWRIPAAKMKMRALHIVPLSRQAVAILRDLQPLTGQSRYLFPSLRSAERPMSENTLNAALRRLGFGKDEMSAHGFRAMASTILNEQGFPADAIERQLAHAHRDPVRGAYDHAEHLPARRKMMQAWSIYLDGLRNGADVVTLKRA